MISSLQADAFVESRGGASLPLTVRKAVMRELAPILDLINGYAGKGVMLPRTEFEMSEAIRDFTRGPIGNRPARLRGAAFLHSRAGRNPFAGGLRTGQNPRRGRRLVKALVQEAQEYELDAAFAFTYVTEFFEKVASTSSSAECCR